MPTPKQQAFLWLTCRDAFFGGAAGGGKSDALLMAALQYVDVPGYSALLIRDTYKNLNKPDSLMSRAHEWLTHTDAHWNGERSEYRFPVDGRYAYGKAAIRPVASTLSFGYLDNPRDHFNYQSAAYQYVGIDEVVAIREKQALYLFSRLRKAVGYENLPIRFRAASNPPTREQLSIGSWVKDRYVNPKTRKKNVIFIPAQLEDNPYLDAEDYEQSLNELDPVTRKQLRDGDWEIQVKGRIFDASDFVMIKEPLKDVIRTVRYWDMAATEPSNENKQPAYTVGCKMSITRQGFLCIEHIRRFRRNPGVTETIIRQTAEVDGMAVRIRMEQEPGASGKMVIANYMRRVLLGFQFRGDKVTGSKFTRALPLSTQVEGHNLYMLEAPWNESFIDEAELWPDGPFLDQIDAAGGALGDLTMKSMPGMRAC